MTFFPRNSDDHPFRFYAPCASGRFVVGLVNLAPGGSVFVWPGLLLPDMAAVDDWYSVGDNYPPIRFGAAAFGEWLNYVARPQTIDKILASDLAAWVAAH